MFRMSLCFLLKLEWILQSMLMSDLQVLFLPSWLSSRKTIIDTVMYLTVGKDEENRVSALV